MQASALRSTIRLVIPAVTDEQVTLRGGMPGRMKVTLNREIHTDMPNIKVARTVRSTTTSVC